MKLWQYYLVILWPTGMKLHHVIAYPKVAKSRIKENLAISNTFEVIAHWVTQSSYYSVILRPTGMKLHHMIAYPKVAE